MKVLHNVSVANYIWNKLYFTSQYNTVRPARNISTFCPWYHCHGLIWRNRTEYFADIYAYICIQNFRWKRWNLWRCNSKTVWYTPPGFLCDGCTFDTCIYACLTFAWMLWTIHQTLCQITPKHPLRELIYRTLQWHCFYNHDRSLTVYVSIFLITNPLQVDPLHGLIVLSHSLSLSLSFFVRLSGETVDVCIVKRTINTCSLCLVQRMDKNRLLSRSPCLPGSLCCWCLIFS